MKMDENRICNRWVNLKNMLSKTIRRINIVYLYAKSTHRQNSVIYSYEYIHGYKTLKEVRKLLIENVIQ